MISESYEEIQAGDAYYDLDIKQLKTMAFVQTRAENEKNARESWMAGWFFDPTVQAKLDSDEWCKANPYAELAFRVEDNGASGDGLRLDIEVTGHDDGPRELASVKLSPRHAAALARALLCAVRMREVADARDHK
jgi:hypothetical protein